MAKRYRRKTNWVPQEQREFTVTDERPDRLDFDRLKDLFLIAALSDAGVRPGRPSSSGGFPTARTTRFEEADKTLDQR